MQLVSSFERVNEGEGAAQQRLPSSFVSGRDQCPFVEAASGGREWFGGAGFDNGVHRFGWELHDEVARASFHAGEEVTVDAQARMPHHRRLLGAVARRGAASSQNKVSSISGDCSFFVAMA